MAKLLLCDVVRKEAWVGRAQAAEYKPVIETCSRNIIAGYYD